MGRPATDLTLTGRADLSADRNLLRSYPVDPRILPYRMVGRLFFRARTVPGLVFWGTAAVVGSAGIITAAHNLYDRGNEEWFDDWWFYPAWGPDDEMPYGAWSVEFVGVNPTFVRAHEHNLAYDYDVGFGRTNPDSSGRDLAQVVGGQLPLDLTQPTPAATSWAAIGYDLIKGAGYTMMRCDGDYQAGISSTWVKQDNLPEGASGAPWWPLRDGTPRPAVNGVMSQTAEGQQMATSSAFGAWVEELRAAVLGTA